MRARSLLFESPPLPLLPKLTSISTHNPPCTGRGYKHRRVSRLHPVPPVGQLQG